MIISGFSERFESLLKEIDTTNTEREKGIRSSFEAALAVQSSDSKTVVAALEGIKNSISPQFRIHQPRLVADLTQLVDDAISTILRRTLPLSAPQETPIQSSIGTVSADQSETQSSEESKPQQEDSSDKASSETDFTNVPILAIEHISSFLDLGTKQALCMVSKEIHNNTQDSRISHARGIVENVYTPFGIHSQPIFTVEEAIAFLRQTRKIVEDINETLPAILRSQVSSKSLIEDIGKLKAFFQTANDYSLWRIFGRITNVATNIPFNKAVRHVKAELEKIDFTQYKVVDLTGRKIPFVPREIGLFTSCDTLSLNGCAILFLPPEIGKLRALQRLSLFENKLTTVPKEIGDLPALQLLNLFENKLTTLPKEIGDLPALEDLNLSYNSLLTIPPELGKLPALKILELSHNSLETVPKELGELPVLRDLDLSHNSLKTVPKELGKLPELRRLQLFQNPLTSVPIHLGNASAPRVLWLGVDSIDLLPQELKDKVTRNGSEDTPGLLRIKIS
jgi:Leucine-rich repeat (LRR) protein